MFKLQTQLLKEDHRAAESASVERLPSEDLLRTAKTIKRGVPLGDAAHSRTAFGYPSGN